MAIAPLCSRRKGWGRHICHTSSLSLTHSLSLSLTRSLALITLIRFDPVAARNASQNQREMLAVDGSVYIHSGSRHTSPSLTTHPFNAPLSLVHWLAPPTTHHPPPCKSRGSRSFLLAGSTVAFSHVKMCTTIVVLRPHTRYSWGTLSPRPQGSVCSGLGRGTAQCELLLLLLLLLRD